MTPMEAALCAKIAYAEDGQMAARRLGFSYTRVQNRSASYWVGTRREKMVIAIRGTVLFGANKPNLDVSLQTDQVPWIGAGLVHEGYHKAFWHIFGDLKHHVAGQQEVYFTGHSMGAAIALLAASVLPNQRSYCFASPRVGNEGFADITAAHNRITRYENRGDFLTKYPLKGTIKGTTGKTAGRYFHVGRTVRLLGFGHSMSAYLGGLEKRRRGQ